MDAALIYDTTNLMALREELKQINETALASGLIAARDGSPVWPARARRGAVGGPKPNQNAAGQPKKPRSAAPKTTTQDAPDVGDIGKAGATRLLAMAGRVAADDSPAVPGTDFTEAGIVRLLAHLRKRRSRGYRFLQRLTRFLTRPVAMGTHTSAGVSVERLQLVSRQLREIEAYGWHRFRMLHAARRGKPAPEAQATKPRAKTTDAAKTPAPTSKRAKAAPMVKTATKTSAGTKSSKRKST